MQREECSITELWVSTKCGESDTTTGLGSCPTVGNMYDKLLPEGITGFFGETSEITGAEHICQKRAINEEVGERWYKMWKAYQDDVIFAHQTDDLSDSQPTKGNIEGGLTTIEEKALGNLEKIGRTSQYIDILEPAEQPIGQRALLHGFVLGGGGMRDADGGRRCGDPHLPHRAGQCGGQPDRAGDQDLRQPAHRAHHGRACGCGRLRYPAREMTIDEAGDALIEMIRRTANGRSTAAEALGHREFSMTKLLAATPMSDTETISIADGHGFSRLSDYSAQVLSGKVKATAEPVCRVSGSTLHVDAANGFAYPALDLGFARGVELARETGVAAVTVNNSHHCGALSLQVDRIAREGLIGLMVANAPASIAPWGATTPLYGTNPIAFAAPRDGTDPLVIDLSLSRVARGKVMNAKKTGKPIPEGWALDPAGQPTTDPEAALAGSMIAIGEAKGTALALMVEILAAVLSGAQTSSEMSSYFSADGPPPASGQFLLMLRPGEHAGFAARLEALLSQITAMEGARLPGSRRLKALEAARTEGLQVPRAYLDEARALAARASPSAS
jgi:(2R)-3-sulfolactate dehydrogenase (NADP+)